MRLPRAGAHQQNESIFSRFSRKITAAADAGYSEILPRRPGIGWCRSGTFLRRGSAIVGENGAGKSTLIKILGGAFAPDSGSIEINGLAALPLDPLDARLRRISVIYQEFNLVPTLSARENIFLGRKSGMLRLISRKEEHSIATNLLNRLGAGVDVETLCRDLTVAKQQMVEIAKALVQRTRIIVMDEPTATLSLREVEALFAIVRELKSQGMGILYVSHRLSEIFDIADRVLILRDGETVGTHGIETVTRSAVIEEMVGRTLEDESPRRSAPISDPGLTVRSLQRDPAVRGLSFQVGRGEVVALTGLVGSGRTETARLIFGAERPDRGEISLDGRQLTIRNPREAIAQGICLLTEDRKQQGLVLAATPRENFGLPNMEFFAPLGWIRQGRELTAFNSFVHRLQIKLSRDQQTTATLSGGNQQKIILAKWLQRHAEVVLFDEPTRGIDVGAKYEIYLLINELAAQGKAILMISSELPEVLGMADRILVMHEGRITGEIRDAANASQEQIMELAVK